MMHDCDYKNNNYIIMTVLAESAKYQQVIPKDTLCVLITT